MTDDMSLLQGSVERFLRTVGALRDDDYSAPSRLPGWTRAHVVTHVARSADSRTGLLTAARSGTIGRQYASRQSRAQAIDVGAARPGYVIRADLRNAMDGFAAAVAEHPEHLWDAPGDWLSAGRQPVRRAVPTMRREVEYHHVDLAAGYRPEDWPQDFVSWQLPLVIDAMAGRPEPPAVTIALPERTRRIRDGGLMTVAGEPPDLLAWLTGRAGGERLDTTPAGPLPSVPPLG